MASNITASITTVQQLFGPGDDDEIEAYIEFADIESGQKVSVPVDMFMAIAAQLFEPDDEPEEPVIEVPQRLVVRSSPAAAV